MPVLGLADVHYDDRSFDHAFGTQHEGSWEIEEIADVRIDGCPLALARHCLGRLGLSRRRLRKASRRLARSFAAAVAAAGEDCFSTADQADACRQASAISQ